MAILVAIVAAPFAGAVVIGWHLAVEAIIVPWWHARGRLQEPPTLLWPEGR